jgi:tetratricopeptide (TPR) repeat protein
MGAALGQQQTEQQHSAQQHYDEAFRLQEAGRTAEADREHKLFLAMALHDIANGRANLGEYGRAVPLYEEALGVTPDDFSLCMDYAGAALDGFDWKKAKAMATAALELQKRSGQPPSTAAVSILAQALMGTGQYRDALEQFKVMAELEPGYKSQFALAGAYLALGDKANAGKILARCRQSLETRPSSTWILGGFTGRRSTTTRRLRSSRKRLRRMMEHLRDCTIRWAQR